MEITPTTPISPNSLTIGTEKPMTRIVSENEAAAFRALTSAETTTGTPTTTDTTTTLDIQKLISNNILNNIMTQGAEERQRLADAIEGKDS